jgi:hypothetical protein
MVDAARQAGISAEFVATPEEAGEWLATGPREGDVVLLNASRRVKLEEPLESLTERSSVVGRQSSAKPANESYLRPTTNDRRPTTKN